MLAVLSEAAWAGCGPRKSDQGLINLLIGLAVAFAVSGPLIGTLLSEIVLWLKGLPRKLGRVALSLVSGGIAFVLLAPALFRAGTLVFWTPVLAGAVSFTVGFLQGRFTAKVNPEAVAPDIGFES